MATDEDRAARQDRMLDELAGLAMQLARDMAAEAKAAETLEERERCVFGFDRMYRAVRLSVALSRRLKRDEAREQAQRQSEGVDLRKARLRARLRAEIKSGDYGFKQTIDLERDLDERLAEDALYQSFLDLPLEAALAHVRKAIGLEYEPLLTSPIEDGGRGTAGRAQRRAGGGGGEMPCAGPAPSTTPSAGRGPPPAAKAGEVRKKPGPD